MNKLEIVSGSLKISNGTTVVLVMPKDACSIDVLAVSSITNPRIVIFNKYLANFTPIFNQLLANCVDSTNTVFTQSSFVSFAEANLGF